MTRASTAWINAARALIVLLVAVNVVIYITWKYKKLDERLVAIDRGGAA